MTRKQKANLLQSLNVLTAALNDVRKQSPRLWGQCKWMQEQVANEYSFVLGQQTPLEAEAPSGFSEKISPEPLTRSALFD